MGLLSQVYYCPRKCSFQGSLSRVFSIRRFWGNGSVDSTKLGGRLAAVVCKCSFGTRFEVPTGVRRGGADGKIAKDDSAATRGSVSTEHYNIEVNLCRSIYSIVFEARSIRIHRKASCVIWRSITRRAGATQKKGSSIGNAAAASRGVFYELVSL